MSSSASIDNAKCIKKLFTRFAAIYGHIWKSQFKSDAFMDFAKKEWMDALGAFSDATVTSAIDECREYHDMPPTLPQFIRCCRAIVKRQFVRVEEKPFTRTRAEIAEPNLRKMKIITGRITC